MGGFSGQYFKQFGLTIASAVFISLMVARLITPVLAAYALRSDSLVVHNVDGPIMTRYLRLLRWCVANRWKTIAAGIVFFVLSVACLGIIPSGFIPPEDFANAELDIELPPGVLAVDWASPEARRQSGSGCATHRDAIQDAHRWRAPHAPRESSNSPGESRAAG